MYHTNTITIIIPVYNAEKTIKRCIDSILIQTYENWQLILVNDGSLDKSGDICNHYASSDYRIRVYHISNGGAGNARNVGLKYCTSKWVTFVDSDDSIEPDYIANFHVNDCKDDEVIIMQGYRRVDSSYNRLSEHICLKTHEYSGPKFFMDAISSDHIFEYGQSIGKVYLLSILQRHKIYFSTDFNISEDHVFYLTYLLHIKKIITYSGESYNYILENNIVTLSQRNHPFIELFSRYIAVKTVCEKLIFNYHITDSKIISKINYFAITGSISMLLKSLFHNEKSYHIRRNILKQILSNKKLLLHKFNPKSIKGTILKYALISFPLRINDLILRLIYK